MIIWLGILMTVSTISALIIITKGLSAMIETGDIKKGLPIFFLGLIVSAEGGLRFANESVLTPFYWGIETLAISIVFIWILILFGGVKDE